MHDFEWNLEIIFLKKMIKKVKFRIEANVCGGIFKCES
jgi:hypothetical protein